jgi:gliding motility-associated-like protein
LGAPVIVEGTGNPIGGAVIRSYNWNFDNGQTGSGQRDTGFYNTPGTYNINLKLVSTDGCVADTTKPLTINPLPPVQVEEDTIYVCFNDAANFAVDSPNASFSYKWYTDTVAGTQLGTGATFSIPSLTQTTTVWVEATSADGCASKRKKVLAIVLFDIDNPVVELDSAGTDFVRFKWAAVTGATRYEVSTDNGVTWVTPSSGPLGTTHTINGLRPSEGRTIIVRAIGNNECQQSDSDPFTGRALPGKVFVANAFSPNGDGLNDVFIINNDAIQNIQFVIYNQWGEKVFETLSKDRGWNGTYKGKIQPSGVYMYVARIEYFDGTTETRKGTINLIR